MKAFIPLFAILASSPAWHPVPDSGPDSFESAVLTLTGASTMEELDEELVSHFQKLKEHPLDINSAGRSRLVSSGLLTAYQTASLLDYRTGNGDLLSLAELSLLDGFSEKIAEALSEFVIISSTDYPGAAKNKKGSYTFTVKGGAKTDGKVANCSGGGKFEFEFADRLEANWAARATYSDKEAWPGTLSAAYYGRKHLGKVVLGHFNARFGQGLALWSGFSMSGVSSAAAMKKNGTGLSCTSSYSPQFCGIASDWEFGKWTAGAAWAFPETPVLSICRIFHHTTVEAVTTGRVVSLNWKAGVRDFSFFGETAWDGAPAALCGLWWVPEYGRSVCAALRYYSPEFNGEYSGALRSQSKVKDEAGASLGYDSKLLNATADLCIHPLKHSGQAKALLTLGPEFALGAGVLKCSMRLSSRYRNPDANPWRNEVRTDLNYVRGGLSCAIRFDGLKCRGCSWLGYSEAGYAGSLWQVYGRWTLFRVDNWEDRIYVYERDAPGNFNVPAYYGRGWGLSLYAGWKPSRRQSVWLRVSTLRYPWTQGGKNPVGEARLQYRLSL